MKIVIDRHPPHSRFCSTALHSGHFMLKRLRNYIIRCRSCLQKRQFGLCHPTSAVLDVITRPLDQMGVKDQFWRHGRQLPHQRVSASYFLQIFIYSFWMNETVRHDVYKAQEITLPFTSCHVQRQSRSTARHLCIQYVPLHIHLHVAHRWPDHFHPSPPTWYRYSTFRTAGSFLSVQQTQIQRWPYLRHIVSLCQRTFRPIWPPKKGQAKASATRWWPYYSREWAPPPISVEIASLVHWCIMQLWPQKTGQLHLGAGWEILVPTVIDFIE